MGKKKRFSHLFFGLVGGLNYFGGDSGAKVV
jgi:hypothetical protein